MAARRTNGTGPRALLEALRRDPNLRNDLIAILGDGVATKSDIAQILVRLDQHAAAIERLVLAVEAQGKRIEEQGHRIEEQGKRIEMAFLHVDALGARWGLKSEASFRDALRTILGRRFGAHVDRWQHEDREGRVFGRPSSIEVDVVVRNGGTLLVEVKAHASRGDVAAFQRKAELYEQVSGHQVDRLLVSPSVEEAGRALAAEVGIEVSTDLS